MPTTTSLLLQWDRQRPRTLQKELGFSEIGGCRRKAGYRLAGVAPSNPGGSVQAAMGTAIHDAIAAICAELGYPQENEVVFAGIKGHYDRVEDAEVVDVKTLGSARWLEHIKLHGPPENHIWQVNGYAAALIMAGQEIKRVRIDYLCRDTGEEWAWRGAFNPRHVKDALDWLKVVRDTELEMLPRDHDPDSSFCTGCPFFTTCWNGHVPARDLRSVLYVEDPDAQKWADALFELRARIKELEAEADRLRGALDAVRPDDGGRVVCGNRVIDFRPTRSEGRYALYFVAGEAS